MFFRFGSSRRVTASAGTSPLTPPIVPNYEFVGFSKPAVTRLQTVDWEPKDPASKYKLYREIYEYDTVAGPAIELMAELPFSEFSLLGVSDKKVFEVFETSLENLKITRLLPELVKERYIIGFVVCSLIFDDSRGVWRDIVIHEPENLVITPIPIRGFDPKIDFVVPPEIKQFLNSKDPRDVDARSVLPKHFIEKLQKSNTIPLEPLNTLYLPRKTHPTDIGTSLLKRIIPLYILEKELMIGTIDASKRRQRGILHIIAGTDEEWEPTEEELSTLAEMFLQADADPQGGVVVTRTGVETNEVRAPTDFWRISEEEDFLVAAKLRSLRINEDFLSGTATYSTMEVALSVFIELLKALRDEITARVFYEKLFPILSKVHGFYERSEADLKHKVRTEKGKKKLLIPKIQWHKQLRPVADKDFLDVLATVKEQGLPIPLRTWASAAGLDLDSIVKHLKEDAELRKKIKEILPQEEAGGGEEW